MRSRITLESFTGETSLSYIEGIYRADDLGSENVTLDTGDISWANARGPLLSNAPIVFDDNSARRMMERMMDADKNSAVKKDAMALNYRIKSHVGDVE